MTDVYAQHRASFPQVSAYVIMYGNERVATIAFKFPRDGAGRLYAYVHWIGTPMVRGYAGGYGYDKRSAACANAAGKMPVQLAHDPVNFVYAKFLDTLAHDGGEQWDNALHRAGFTVYQAV